MSNPNEHIEEFLRYYFKLPSPPQYAVLLKGKWGVGKTWFLKKIMSQLDSSDNQKKRHLYVSLYGIASFEEIENEFFRQLHPVLSSKGMALAGKIGKGLLKTALKIDLNDDGKSDASVSSQVPDINLPDYLSNTEGLILVFDDLERASMDLENLLGYINYFVEHQGYKVVIIANEDELVNKEKTSDVSYKRIKEKLIGKTFEIQPRLESAISNFIHEIESDSTQELFNNNIGLIKDYYRRSAYWNLRHLRQALMDFSRLLESLSDEIKDKEGIVEQLLSTYLVLSFEIKSGEMLPADINNFNESYLAELMDRSNNKGMTEEVIDSPYRKVKEKYPAFDLFDMLLEKSIWIDIFDKGLIDKAKIEESLKSSRYFHSDNQPEWMQLWHFMYLKDDDFDNLLKSVTQKFQDKEYKEIEIIMHIAGLFLELSSASVLDITKAKILELAKSHIDKLVEEKISVSHRSDPFHDTSSKGLQYYSKDSNEFRELFEYISSMSEKQINDSLPQLGIDLLDDIKNRTDSFYKKISYTGSMNEYHRYPVLKYIRPKDFVKAIIENEPYKRRDIILAISSRYKSSGNIEILSPEIGWLQETVYLLLKQAERKEGKISNLQIKYFTNAYLVSSINILHEASLNPKQAANYCWIYSQNSVGIPQTAIYMKKLGMIFNLKC
ncbi:P-loop NTPase fold protein [Psychrobacter nivimaris]|uniref:P-loop NTPase fold protein n=1 Tax=Psychrobacter nivimaris TaxID=281738 RepID=UPI0037360B09